MREAMYYTKQDNGLLCLLCPKRCVIKEGMTGFCRVRRNRGDKLYTENYGFCSSYAIDPIEKKPLYHFYPGRYIFSVGTWGCNFACRFCQNWQIAQQEPDLQPLSPERAVEAAKGLAHNIGIAYTYSEPGVWFEYVLETAGLAKKQGLKNVMVTNGFINAEPLRELLPVMDAFNIDVKAFTEEFYRDVCAGTLGDVKRTVELAAAHSHVEVTTLLIPGLNDKESEISALARWLSGISPDIPLHLSRYFPNYKLDRPATSETILKMAYKEARRFMHYVYIGNVADERVNTYCFTCGELLIDRLRRENRLTPDKHCPKCGSKLPIAGNVDF